MRNTNGGIAQLGEHLPYKQRVIGSSPIVPTIRTSLSDNESDVFLLTLKRFCNIIITGRIKNVKLYKLDLYDLELSHDDYKEGFSIGIFSSSEKAEQTAKYYIRNVNGFKDYICDYLIKVKNVIGTAYDLKQVYIIEGWNINKEFDEIDIVESDCFTDIKSAETELEIIKKKYDRCEWVIDRYVIDECQWTEGFVRM